MVKTMDKEEGNPLYKRLVQEGRIRAATIEAHSLFPSRKRLVRPLLCCILRSSASIYVFWIAGIRRWFPIEMSAPGFGQPICLVQLSLLEAPAVVRLRTPRPRFSHSQSIFFLSFFIFLSCIFLSIHRSASCR